MVRLALRLYARRHDQIDWSRDRTALRHAEEKLDGIVSIYLGWFEHRIKRVDQNSSHVTKAARCFVYTISGGQSQDLFFFWKIQERRWTHIYTNGHFKTDVWWSQRNLKKHDVCDMRPQAIFRKRGEEDRARTWIGRGKSALLQDQVFDQETCVVFGGLIAFPARFWYIHLSRLTRFTWKALVKSFMVDFCGPKMPVN